MIGDVRIIPVSEITISITRFKKRCAREISVFLQMYSGVSTRFISSEDLIMISEIFGGK